MSEPASRVDELMHLVLCGDAVERDETELETALDDEQARRRAVAWFRLERRLREHAAEKRLDELSEAVAKRLREASAPEAAARVTRSRRSLRPSRNRRLLSLVAPLAAAALILVVVQIAAARRAASDLPMLVEGGRSVAVGAHAGAVDRTVVLRYADGTAFTLARGADLVVEAGDGKRVRLERGALHAEVAKQTPGRPLLIGTPNGTAEVVGTVFDLSVTAETRLDVAEGRVRLSGSDGTSVLVASGESAVAGASVALVPRQPERAVVWSRDFAAAIDGDQDRGELIDGAIGSIAPEASMQHGDWRPDQMLQLMHAWVDGRPQALFTVPADMRLHLRLRAERVGKVSISLAYVGQQIRNEAAAVEDLELGPQWQELDLSSRDFAATPGGRALAPGIPIGSIAIWCFGAGRVELDDISVSGAAAAP